MTTENKAPFAPIKGETAKETTALLNKECDSVKRRSAKLDKDLWRLAVSAMAHHAEHGDVTVVNNVVASMGKGLRGNAMKDFIMAHGKVSYDEANKCFAHDKQGSFDLEGAMAKSWTEYKPEAEYKPFDAKAALTKLVKDAKKAMAETDKAKAAKNKITPEQYQTLLQTAEAMGVELN